mmetsp:Transcript_25130/g.53134  ORF Transcript_25130/g.53134 Transcript_25130/m.53134 type:complete len:173 (+) Transcript_25130:28-546(+)
MVALRNIAPCLLIVVLISGMSSEALTRLSDGRRNTRQLRRRRVGGSSLPPRLSHETRIQWQRKTRRKKKDRSSNKSRSSSASTKRTPCFAEGDEISLCPDGEYCRLVGDTCKSFAYGSCEEMSRRCTREYKPVCTCDGVTTYANPCVASYDLAKRGNRVGFSKGKCQDNGML